MKAKIETLDTSIIKREDYESKRCFEIAQWYLKNLNQLVTLYNQGYGIYENDQRIVPDLSAEFYPAKYHFEGDKGIFDKSGSLRCVKIGAELHFGHCREFGRGRIFVGMTEAKGYFKSITVTPPGQHIPFMEFIK